MDILVRFNHNATNDLERWRMIWDGKEFICTSISFECATSTVKRAVLVNGEPTVKWHISPTEPKEIIFRVENGQTHVTIL